MNIQELVEWKVLIAGLYLAIGVLFAIPFVLKGVSRVDPVAAEGTKGFRALIFPGVVVLWPLMLARLMSNASAPPEERNAHRRAAVPREGGEA